LAKKNRNYRGRIFIPYEKVEKGPSWASIIILFVLQIWPVAAYLLYKRLRAEWKIKKQADYRNYAAVIGDRVEVDIRELSAKLGKTPALVMGDLQAMIEKGYLGANAYVDKARGVLIMDALATKFTDEEPEVVVEEPVREVKVEREPVRPVREVNLKRESVQPSVPLQEDEFETKLREIRMLNDQIDDEAVSQRIDRIGELTASIFFVVREKPDRADEVKKFLNYYLPTTCKLLKSYSLMEKQSFQGENIAASRKKIEGILDQLIQAFEQQQDRLFRTEALDVEADIEVLETMMAKDGLVTPKGMDIRMTMGGK